MKSLSRSGFLPVVAACIAGAGAWMLFDTFDDARQLPVFNGEGEGVYAALNSYHLIDEDSLKYESLQLEGKPLIVNFFFSTCPTVCPAMNDAFQTVLEEISPQHFNGISITVDPVYDRPGALKTYRQTRGYLNPNWSFLTGDKKEIYKMAIEEFRITAAETPQDEIPFIHSDKIVLVDTLGRIRGYYSGTDQASIADLKKDIKKLVKSS